MNQQILFLAGRSTSDAEILEAKSRKNYLKFHLAVNEYDHANDKPKVNFYEVLGFNKQHLRVGEKIKKGDSLLVQGDPEYRAYIDKNGMPQHVTICKSREIVHMGGKTQEQEQITEE